MKVAGVVGWPVGHSLSPRLHRFWLREHGVNGAYVQLPARQYDLSTVLRGLRAAGLVGVNVTIPHKEAAFALAKVCDVTGRIAGAANLLLFHDDYIEARNSDAGGLEASIVEEIGADAVRSRQVIVLGAGGAARAAVLACDNLKAAAIHVLNRTPGRARNLVDSFENSVSATLSAGLIEDWPVLAPATHLLINATSLGMKGSASPALPLELLPRDALVCDMVYDPLETPLLARARSLGLHGINGLGMLIHQAAPAFQAFFGIRPEASAALRADLEKALHK
jgi:shikimate dehydrogenase